MKNGEKTFLVLGVSLRQLRYANLAVRRLVSSGYAVIAVGKQEGEFEGVPVLREIPGGIQVHTVLVYLSSAHQGPFADVLLAMKPQRVIFNPGAENDELSERLRDAGVLVVESCALVMHSLKKL